MELPNPYGMHSVGPTLWSTDTHQYAVVVRPDAEVSVHKRARPDGAWTSHVITGAARTKLSLPLEPDDHNYMAIAVDSRGYIHVMGNMHAYFNETRYIVSTNPGDITSWSNGSLPGLTTDYRLTYPQFARRGNGGLMLFLRAYGGSGGGDYHYWHLAYDTAPNTWSNNTKIWQGLGSTPDWSAYLSWAETDPLTGRLGVGWVWREDANDPDGCRWPSFAYMAGIGEWFDVTGTQLTLPITPYNNLGTHISHALYAQDSSTPTPVVGMSGFAWDTNSRPHLTLATMSSAVQETPVSTTLSPLDHVFWDGSTWQREAMLAASPLETRLSCYAPSAHLFSHGGDLHLMGVQSDGRAFTSKSLVQAEDRSFWGHTRRHSLLNNPPFSNGIHSDPEARRLDGLTEFLIPDGNNPVVHRHGLRHRIKV